MASKYKYETVLNEAHDDYECLVHVNGKSYKFENINAISSTSPDGLFKTTTAFDTETGEIVYESTKNPISEQNSKAHTYMCSCDFAKSKKIPRIKVKANGKHIVELCKENSEYLQASTGSSHDKRGIVTVDIDTILPNGMNDPKIILEHVTHKLDERLELLRLLNIPLPSAYQVNLKNGHLQMQWFLVKEITIKTLNYTYVPVGNTNTHRKSFYLENLPKWKDYMRATRFLNILFDGDPAFTGWQIKNMFLSDPVFTKSFKTFWNVNGEFVEEQPKRVAATTFKRLYSNIYEYIESTEAPKYKLLRDIAEASGVSTFMLEHLANGAVTITDSILLQNGLQHRNNDVVSLHFGRNQFTRMKTFEVIRTYRNHINMDDCRKLVKKMLVAAMKRNGVLSGTKNTGPYTEREFERDFRSAYTYAVATYKSLSAYTPEQRERAVSQIKAKKNNRLCMMLVFLEHHSELIPDTAKNAEKLMKLYSEQGITIKSRSTISTYKKNLGITKSQRKLSPKNYKFADEGYNQRAKRVNDLLSAYATIDREMLDKKKLFGWKKRIRDIYSSKMNSEFLKRKRNSSKIHKIKIIYPSHSSKIISQMAQMSILSDIIQTVQSVKRQ